MKLHLVKFLPAIIWLLLSIWLLTIPGSKIPHQDWFDTFQVDKWVHICLFFILCFLFMLPFKKQMHTKKTYWFATIAFLGIVYGIGIEFIQRDYIANRSFDIWDIVADIVGCSTAFALARKKLVGI